MEWQSHIGVLETTTENQSVLLMGLEYLIGISYVDDTEVFKVRFSSVPSREDNGKNGYSLLL